MERINRSGLRDWTERFLFGEKRLVYTEEITRVYPDGHREPAESRSVYEPVVEVNGFSEYTDSNGAKHTLHQYTYTFPDGRTYVEYVQAEIALLDTILLFRALKDKDGGVVHGSLWPDKVINAVGEMKEVF